jgi:polyisoprenyl-phosphate glycosyltransferase
MDHTVKISVVSPVYGSPALISILCDRLHKALGSLTESYEIILVFDDPPDDGWQRIHEECKKDHRVKGIQLSRNFGQHYAITAGLANVSGEWIAVMDCDLQDQPEEIPNLFNKAMEGYDLVFARRINRRDSFVKKMTSKMFYSVFGYMTDSNQDASIANFGVYHHLVIQAVLSMKDKVRYFPTMAQWVGFKRTSISVAHSERQEGKSSYTWRRLFHLALDNIIVFSDKPLRLTVKLGIIVSLGSFTVGCVFFLRYLFGGIIVSGFTSLILSIWFLSGTIIFLLGVIGIYLGRMFDQVKDRPTYIVREKLNVE